MASNRSIFSTADIPSKYIPSKKECSPVYIDSSVRRSGCLIKIPEISIGGLILKNKEVVISKSASYNLIGADILNNFIYILDIPGQALWLSPDAAPQVKRPFIDWSPVQVRRFNVKVKDTSNSWQSEELENSMDLNLAIPSHSSRPD